MTKDRAQLDYLRWLSVAAPATFAKIAPRLDARLGDLGWITAVIQAVAAVGSAVMAKKQQDKAKKAQKKAQAEADAETTRIQKELADTLVQTNTRRAQQGLPPVDQYGNVIASAALPNGGVVSSYYDANGNPLSQINPLWLVGGGVALVALVLIVRR